MEETKKNSIISVSFIITGNSVGSGLLALPICVGLAGIIPGVIVVLVGSTFMTATGLVLASIVNEKKDVNFDLPSIYESVLGKGFKWIAVVANMLVLYGLLVAYLACLTSIAQFTFGIRVPMLPLFIFVIITSVNFFALEIIKRSNAVLVSILFVSFFVLVTITGEHMYISNLEHIKWIFLPLSLPVLVNSFNFHNVIPISCRLLRFEKKRVYTAILLGVLFSFILNVVWCFVVAGALKYSGDTNCSEIYAFKHNLPATVPLGTLFKSTLFNVTGLLFAIAAVITSYWTVGAALTSFLGDLRRHFLNKGGYFYDVLLAFIPPLIITIICPDVFISIQDIVGGIGIAVLFGILPSIIFYRKLKGFKKVLPGVMIAFFTVVMLLALLHKFNLVTYF